MALKAIGIVLSLESKLLIVGNSVMCCFVQASGDGDASPDPVFISILVAAQVREKNLAGKFADSILSARHRLLA